MESASLPLNISFLTWSFWQQPGNIDEEVVINSDQTSEPEREAPINAQLGPQLMIICIKPSAL